MLQIIRTNATHSDFVHLVQFLDAELRIRDGEDHAFYAQYNGSEAIRHVLIAYQGDKPVGCGAIKQYNAEIMEVKRMYVAPEYRGQGIAATLLQHLEAWAKELGSRSCILETGINQPEAIALYQKCGYHRIENYGQYAGVEASFCFEKHL